MIMYKREEVVEEEHLEWEDKPKDRIQKTDVKVNLSSEEKRKNVFLNKNNELDKKSDIQPSLMTYFDGNEYLWLGVILLIVPYFVGLLFISVLFYIYSGITLDKVFSIEKEYKLLELWTIGAYTFVTIWIIWILLKIFKESR